MIYDYSGRNAYHRKMLKQHGRVSCLDFFSFFFFYIVLLILMRKLSSGANDSFPGKHPDAFTSALKRLIITYCGDKRQQWSPCTLTQCYVLQHHRLIVHVNRVPASYPERSQLCLCLLQPICHLFLIMCGWLFELKAFFNW